MTMPVDGARYCGILIVFLSALTTVGSELPAEAEVRYFDHVIMTYMRERHIPGASIAISVGGQFLVRKGYGKANSAQIVSPWSLFRIGSVSKTLTAMGILRLYEEGRLKLNESVFGTEGILRQYKTYAVRDDRLYHVTVTHLLRHMAGWDHSVIGDPLMRRDIGLLLNQSGSVDKDDIVRFMMRQPLQFDPGSQFCYSNFGYLLLGRVIERVAGVSYDSYIRGLLWSVGIYRMKLGNTSKELADDFEVEYYSEYPADRVESINPKEGLVSPPYGGFSLENMAATSGWLGSATELVKFFESLNGTGKDEIRILKPDTFRLMLTDGAARGHRSSRKIWYGMGLVIQDEGRTYWHNGHLEGSTALASHDEDGVVWAILTNYKVDNGDLADVMRFAIRTLRRKTTYGVHHNGSASNVDPRDALAGAHAVSKNAKNVVKLLIPEFKFKEAVGSLAGKGYRITWIDAVEYYGLVYFNTIWTKNDRTKWKVFIDLSPSRYRRRFKAKMSQGYRLAFIETYTQRKRLRYAAIFIRDGWPPWVTYHGYSPHKHKEMFYYYLEQGYQLTVQSVTEYKGKVYVAAIYEKIYLGDIRVRMGLTKDDLAEELNMQMKRGRILSYIQAYERLGRVRFSAIWIPQTTFAWAASDSMTKYTLLYKLQQYADVDVPLSCVTCYVEDDTLKFAALWL